MPDIEPGSDENTRSRSREPKDGSRPAWWKWCLYFCRAAYSDPPIASRLNIRSSGVSRIVNILAPCLSSPITKKPSVSSSLSGVGPEISRNSTRTAFLVPRIAAFIGSPVMPCEVGLLRVASEWQAVSRHVSAEDADIIIRAVIIAEQIVIHHKPD